MAVYLGKNKVGMVKKFTPIDRLQWKCDNLKTLYYEFYNHNIADLQPAIDGLDTSNVTNMRGVFGRMNSGGILERLDLSHFNTSKVTTMREMFKNSTSITELNVSNFDTGNLSDAYAMFMRCSSINELDLSHFNTSKVTNMEYMFSGMIGITKINVSNWNTSQTIYMGNMFEGCHKLAELIGLEGFDTSKVTSMRSMFQSLLLLERLDLSSFNTSKVTNMYAMFSAARNLKEILGTLDLYSLTNSNLLINDTPNLEKVTFKNIRIALKIGSSTSYGTKLTFDTIINTIKELWDYSGTTKSYTLTMSTTSKNLIADVYVKLVDVTDEMLAQDQYADQKMPCVVCDSTDEGAMLITSYANLKGWTIA